MDPYFKAARSVIRFAAVGMMVIGALMLGLEFASQRANGLEVNVAKAVGYGFLVIAGVGLFAGAGMLAGRLTNEDDGENGPDNQGGDGA